MKRMVVVVLCAFGLILGAVGTAAAHHGGHGHAPVVRVKTVDRVVHIDSHKCRKIKRKARWAHSPRKRARMWRKYNRKCTYVETVRVPVRPRPVVVHHPRRPKVVVATPKPRVVVVHHHHEYDD